MSKRGALIALLICTVAGVVPAASQGYPNRPVRIVVPFPPGGSPDIFARAVGQQLTDVMGQPFVVENKPGANGILAAETVTKSAPDGYTLLIADTGHLAINPHLYAKLPYDPLKDLTPIVHAMVTPMFLTIGAKLPAQSVAELVSLSKTRPNMRYGSSGNGSVHHLGMVLFTTMTGANLEHVPYKGVAQSVPGLLAGEVDTMISGLASIRGNVRNGTLRVLAVGSSSRTPIMPEVPTLAESGLTGYDIDSRNGFLGPAGLDKAIVDRLNREIIDILSKDPVRSRFAEMGIVILGGTPDDYARSIRDDMVKYGKLVKISGARVE